MLLSIKVGAGLLPAQFAFGAAAALAVVVQPKAMLVLSFRREVKCGSFYRFITNFQRQIFAHLAHICPVLRFKRGGRVFAPSRKPVGKRADNRFTGTQGTKVTNVFYTEFVSSLTTLSSLPTAEEGIYFTSNSRVPLLR